MKLVPKFICGMNSAYLTSGPTIKRYISEKFNPILNVKLNVIQLIVFDIFRYIIEFDSTNQSKHCCHNGFKKKYFHKLFWLFAGVSSSSSCFEEAQWQVQWDVYQRSGGHLQKERKSLDLNWGKWSCVQCCDVITMFMSSSLVLYMHGFKGVLGTISKCDTCNFNKFVFNLRCYFMQ